MIVCDVDNGPTWLVLPDNADMYGVPALELLSQRLAAGGALGFWSHERVEAFEQRLARIVGSVTTRPSVDVHPAGRALESYVIVATSES